MMFTRIREWFSRPDLKNKFSDIYSNHGFGGQISRSGEGSDLIQTAQIRLALPELLKEYDISSFLDAPCGDWYWMKEVDLGVDRYIGIDIVEDLIERNREKFETDSRTFQCLNMVEDQLPEVDLVFCRDCLVHLTFSDALKVISNFRRSKSRYILTTTFTDRERNIDLRGKDVWRTLNMCLPPFNFPEPLKLMNEKCTEANNQFTDKCLGLWRLDDID
ncbi:MAG: class I SAM-dependent methyltransferase [Mariprofundaceae bacterium]